MCWQQRNVRQFREYTLIKTRKTTNKNKNKKQKTKNKKQKYLNPLYTIILDKCSFNASYLLKVFTKIEI